MQWRGDEKASRGSIAVTEICIFGWLQGRWNFVLSY